jgi:hypothetical protein
MRMPSKSKPSLMWRTRSSLLGQAQPDHGERRRDLDRVSAETAQPAGLAAADMAIPTPLTPERPGWITPRPLA